MKALILNSGMGSRMGDLTSHQPKCLTRLSPGETILSRQLRLLAEEGIQEVVMTTGYQEGALVNYCGRLDLPLHITFVKNPAYENTNYIYSIYLARRLLDDDILLLHGDLVFESLVLESVLTSPVSCVAVSSSAGLPEKDFKAIIQNGLVTGIGVEFFQEALAAQPMYLLKRREWRVWLGKITEWCEAGRVQCYAEEAFNEVSRSCPLSPLDVKDQLCGEVDSPEDLAVMSSRLRERESRTVYMCFSTDILHSGHMAIIKRASKLGRLIIGVLSDEAVISYKRFPLLPYSERRALLENIRGVYKVVEQRTLSYRENLEKYRPAYLVHGDDWARGVQRPVRDEAAEILAGYGGTLVEYPYAREEKYRVLEERARADLSLPDVRRSRLRGAMSMKGLVTALEAHSGITGLIGEKTVVYKNGEARQFDAMWVSSLCDSTARGKPDIEVVDMSSRFRTVDEIMEVTTKPVIFDGDTGGQPEHFAYTVRTLERLGVSMVIIEDKTGLKKNSLFGTEVYQTQDSVENFCQKIRAGKRAKKTKDFLICARIESLILEKGIEDALERGRAYVEAGADAVMIHSRKKDPGEIFEFVERFRREDKETPVVVVPTAFSGVSEEEFKSRGVNVVIYANHLTRSGFPAMERAARLILENRRAEECDEICMPIREIITLIDGEWT